MKLRDDLRELCRRVDEAESDPERLKAAINDLRNFLAEHYEAIGALLEMDRAA